MPLRTVINVPVSFPYDPYTMQLSMMTRIIAALNNKQNCLLESPTGTGKTMALLCASLAWIKNEGENRQKDKNGSENDSKNEFENKTKIPKIFFGTRTHKQIGQVVREMSRSAYSDIPMTILSSRKQTCINSKVLNKTDIEQACHDACKKKDCHFSVKPTPIPFGTWDIESIKTNLREKLICPFYQSRNWVTAASITFCPYNYILNPSIRKSMSIDLRNAIVILDEGHNIEDICRDGSSTEVTLESLNSYHVQFLPLLKSSIVKPNVSTLIELIKSLKSFIESLASKLIFMNEDILKKTWATREAIAIMNQHKLDIDSIKEYMWNINKLNDLIKKQEKDNDSSSGLPVINMSVLNNLSSTLVVLDTMLKEPKDVLSSFRVVVMEGEAFTDLLPQTEGNYEDGSTFLNASTRKRKPPNTNYILNVLCMNPGIVFKEIAAKTHSIILASGTLSPMTSFQRELSCTFDTSLEAGHVVKLNQTMVASIGCGPRGISLNATYKNVETFAFQDELGALLLDCCKSVPYGVLCFVSSFQMIDKLFKRWQATKLVNEIQKYKSVLIEPRNSTEMTKCMEDYESYVERGALLMAVYRGKASEGMDFSNNAARLVITVGIPFPSITDFKVNLKKEYNDNKCRESLDKVLSGREWYSIQAFRALNQALGRCIRHRDDWGAMIMVDDRFSNDYYNQGLCKWIKQRKRHFENWTEFILTLDKFVAYHIEKPKEESSNI